MSAPRPLLVGAHALLVELATEEAAEAFHAEVLRRRTAGELPPVREIVPGARTVLLDGLDDPRALAEELTHSAIPPLPPRDGAVVDIPVRYDGPDLAEVAALWRVPPDALPRVLDAIAFRVAFTGFAPGFGYLSGLPAQYHTPRRATPRTSVPAGSVGLAGPYAGVYPRSSPGGWQIIGSTDAALWDPAREPAALLTPGAQVRFTRVPS
ncbi:carboxyltransferase domain-containing protein [Streptomyces sp. NPDC020096]